MLEKFSKNDLPEFPVDTKFNWEKVYYTDPNLLQFKPFSTSAVVGLLSWRIEDKKTFHVSKIEVFKIFQGAKHGKKFIEEIEKLCKVLECDKIDLWCEDSVKQFYVKLGFETTYETDFVNGAHIEKLVRILTK